MKNTGGIRVLYIVVLILAISLASCDDNKSKKLIPGAGDEISSTIDSGAGGSQGGTGNDGSSGSGGSSGSDPATDWPVSPLDGVVVIPETENIIVENRRYPVILVPGWAGTEKFMSSIDYFYKIPGFLTDAGRPEVSVAPLKCFSEHHVRAAELRDFIYQKLYVKVRELASKAGTGPMNVDLAPLKYNLVCHSQGGIIGRYLSKVLSIPDPRYDDAASAPLIPASRFVASIVMLSAPNRGTYIAQWIVEAAPKPLSAIAEWVFNNLWAGLIAGQKGNDFIPATTDCTENYMTGVFNPLMVRIGRQTPHIKVFTYSATVPGASFNLNSLIIFPLWAIINSDPKYNGNNPNDGVVPRYSAEWAPASGEEYAVWRQVQHVQGWLPIIGTIGVDHWMLVNQLLGFHPGFDARQFYTGISDLLKNEGM